MVAASLSSPNKTYGTNLIYSLASSSKRYSHVTPAGPRGLQGLQRIYLFRGKQASRRLSGNQRSHPKTKSGRTASIAGREQTPLQKLNEQAVSKHADAQQHSASVACERGRWRLGKPDGGRVPVEQDEGILAGHPPVRRSSDFLLLSQGVRRQNRKAQFQPDPHTG